MSASIDVYPLGEVRVIMRSPGSSWSMSMYNSTLSMLTISVTVCEKDKGDAVEGILTEGVYRGEETLTSDPR